MTNMDCLFAVFNMRSALCVLDGAHVQLLFLLSGQLANVIFDNVVEQFRVHFCDCICAVGLSSLYMNM